MNNDNNISNPKQKIGSALRQREKLFIREEENELLNSESNVDNNLEEDISEQYSPEEEAYFKEIEEEKNRIDTTTEVPIDTTIIVNTEQFVEAKSTVKSTVKNTFFTQEELVDFVQSAAGPFYAAYLSAGHIQTKHLQNGGEQIRREAAKELIEFGKVLLSTLKKEIV